MCNVNPPQIYSSILSCILYSFVFPFGANIRTSQSHQQATASFSKTFPPLCSTYGHWACFVMYLWEFIQLQRHGICFRLFCWHVKRKSYAFYCNFVLEKHNRKMFKNSYNVRAIILKFKWKSFPLLHQFCLRIFISSHYHTWMLNL